MPISKLYRTWKEQVRAIHSKRGITQMQNFAWMMVGIFQSRSAQMKSSSAFCTHSTVRGFIQYLALCCNLLEERIPQGNTIRQIFGCPYDNVQSK